jgi:putative transposase
MTTLDGVTKKKKQAEPSAEQRAAAELVRLAQEQGPSLPDRMARLATRHLRCQPLLSYFSTHTLLAQ